MNSYRDLYNSKYRTIKALGWSGWGSQDREEQSVIFLERILSNEYTPNSGTGLELGCGEGQLSRKLSSHGFKMSAVDISDTALKWAEEKTSETIYSINYFRADLAEANVDLGGPYDLIVDGNCLHCLTPERRMAFYRNVSAALATDGVFYVSARCSKTVPRTAHDSDLEYRYFGTVSETITELIQAGFKVLSHMEYDRGEQIHLDAVLKKNQPISW